MLWTLIRTVLMRGHNIFSIRYKKNCPWIFLVTPFYLPCVQQASCLEGGPLLWILPLYLHINQKSNDNDDPFLSETLQDHYFYGELQEIIPDS